MVIIAKSFKTAQKKDRQWQSNMSYKIVVIFEAQDKHLTKYKELAKKRTINLSSI